MTKENTRIGEKFTSNEGYEFIIIEYNNCEDLWIQFEDKYGAKVHTRYQNCRTGQIKNPYHPSVFGCCYLGLLSDGSRPKTTDGKGKHTREYDVWCNMVERCYSTKWHNRHPTYKDVTLDENLHCFAYFLEHIHLIPNYEYWLEHPNEGVSLDKDIRGKGNKIYSLDTIMFVSKSENSREVAKRYGVRKNVKVQGENIKTSEKTKVFESMNEAERETGVNHRDISACVNGRRNDAGGYKWIVIA